MHAIVRNIDELTPAWKALEARVSIKLSAIRSKRHYKTMIAFMNELLDEIGDRESHVLAGLLDVVTMFVREYESREINITEASPGAVLRFLMDQRGLQKVDFADVLGSQAKVSDVLNGKREIHAHQAKALGRRLVVSPAVFI